jgi:hypothetical protein
MKKTLLLAGLAIALTAPVAQAGGLHLRGGVDKIDVPALVSLLNSQGGSLANFRGKLVSNPHSWLRSHRYSWLRTEYKPSYRDPEGGGGGYCPPSVPEGGNAMGVLAASVLGLGIAGYRYGQRRRVLGAA